jgi:carboxypeptidase PM20D1
VIVFQAGTKDNVRPTHAKAVVNFRILPGDSIATVLQHVRRTVDDDRVEIRVAGRFSAEPSAVSSTDAESFRIWSEQPGAFRPKRSLHRTWSWC